MTNKPAVTTATDAELIANYIRQHGVTLCPPAYATECSASIGSADHAMLAAHDRKMEAALQRHYHRYKGKADCLKRSREAIQAWKQQHSATVE